MKAFTISDLHIDFYLGSDPKITSIQEFLKPHLCDADIIIVAGDISNYVTSTTKTIHALAQMYKSVVWTVGNHDFMSHNGENSYTKIDRLSKKVNAPNAYFMNGTTINIDGVSFGGSMGCCDFSYAEKHFDKSKEYMAQKWLMTYDGIHWNIGEKRILDVWADEYSKLSDCVLTYPNVMVSHFGPAAVSIHPRYHNPETGNFYFDGLNLLQQMPPNSVWCFGHTHDYFDMKVGDVRLLCNPLGFPDESRNELIPKERFLFDIK